MSVTAEKEKVVLTPENTFRIVCDKMNKLGVGTQINRHIVAVTGCGNIVIYHTSSKFTDAQKVETYKRCMKAMLDNDFSILEGQSEIGKGSVRVDPVDEVYHPTKKEAAPPATTQEAPPKQQPVSPSPKVAPTPRSVKPESNTDTDEDALELARMLRRLKGSGGKAEINREEVEQIAEEVLSDRIATFEVKQDEELGDKIKKHLGNGAFPTDRVTKLIDEAIKAAADKLVHRMEFVTHNGEVKSLEGLMHPQVPQVVTWLRAGVPVWIWSAAGSGKTHMARQIATMLEVNPHVISVDPTLTVAKLMGYRNVANGDFVEGYVFKPFKEGGLMAMDEVDTGDPGVIASSNALLSNSHYLFPNNETVAKHPQFYTLAMANTKGMGAVAGYTARNRLDAATLDRFAIIEIKYDAGMESALACGIGKPGEPWKSGKPATIEQQQAYVKWVQDVRVKFGTSILVSPRASINGCKALRAGVPMKEVIDALVFKLVTEDSIRRITSDCPLPV